MNPDRWQARPVTAASRWYTVEIDTNGIPWLVAGDADRVRLEPGMHLDIAQIAWQRALSTEVAPPLLPKNTKSSKKGHR